MIVNKYKILDKIGEGRFGDVYKGLHFRINEEIAIKFEKKDIGISILKHETTILNYLHSNHCSNIPLVYWFGKFEKLSTLIMPFYESSLETVIQNSISNISIDQQYFWIKKMVEIMENIHYNFVIHRDIKPQNFMFKQNDIYLIDFGLATIFVDDQKKHIVPRNDKTEILGTPKFISANIHNGMEPSRRDDLISLGFIWIYLFNKTLSWTNINKFNYPSKYPENHILHEYNQMRLKHKSWITMCEHNTMCPPLMKYLEYTYSLSQTETPNYEKLHTFLYIT